MKINGLSNNLMNGFKDNKFKWNGLSDEFEDGSSNVQCRSQTLIEAHRYIDISHFL